MRCKNCKFFKYDSEYKSLGDCTKIFAEFIHIQFADAWFVEPEFGCIYGELAAEELGAPAEQSGEAPRQQLKPKMPSFAEVYTEWSGVNPHLAPKTDRERIIAHDIYNIIARHFGH